MYSTKEIEKFEELSEALDLINASKYTEAQIRGIEHYLALKLRNCLYINIICKNYTIGK